MGYTEFTGVPCSGKSSIINKTNLNYLSGGDVFFNGKKVGCHIFNRVLFIIIGQLYLFVQPKKMAFIFQGSIKMNASFGDRVSALRNAIEKFGCYLIFKKKEINVDEGITHIPFVLQLSGLEINKFLMLFKKEISSMSVAFVFDVSEDILFERLKTRGHKKINKAIDSEVLSFLQTNTNISKSYKSKLELAGIKNVKYL